MTIHVESYGTLPDGRQALLYTLGNNSGMQAQITNFGGIIVSLSVPDRHGHPGDVVLGHPGFADYVKNPNYFGALVGRNSNRIGDAKLNLVGKVYALDKNDGNNNLHGGNNGLSYRLMTGEARTVGNQPVLLLTHTMEDMSDGFPGNLTISVAYALSDDNTLMIDYRGVCDQDTVINLTNHSYFNLSGHDSGPIDGHILQIDAPFYSPNTPECMPTGEIQSVTDTPFDFTSPKPIGQGFRSDCEQIKLFGGYDHNMVLDGCNYRKFASITDENSGRKMEISTNLPGVQLYTGNAIAPGTPGKNGAVYGPHYGFCMETQFFPNAMQMPWLLSPFFRADEEYVTTTGYHFTTI